MALRLGEEAARLSTEDFNAQSPPDDEQAAHITAYLMTLGAKTERPGFAQKLADNTVAEAGNRLIGRYGCYGCHEIYGMEAQPRVGA